MAGHSHSVDEYLETIYFLAFPIGEYSPNVARSAHARLARRRDARRLPCLGRRDAEAPGGRRAHPPRRAQGGDPHQDGPRPSREGRSQAPDHRAAADRFHGLHRRRGPRARGRARRHVLRRHGRAHRGEARQPRPLPTRLAGRSRLRAGGEPRPGPAGRARARNRARRSSASPSTTAISCTTSTTRASCPGRRSRCAPRNRRPGSSR